MVSSVSRAKLTATAQPAIGYVKVEKVEWPDGVQLGWIKARARSLTC